MDSRPSTAGYLAPNRLLQGLTASGVSIYSFRVKCHASRPEDAPADRNRAAMAEHANEVVADDNAGTLLAIESTKQLKARYVTAAEWDRWVSTR